MNTILSPNNWNSVAKKNNVKDNGLGRALSVYEKVDEKKYDDQTKAIAAVIQFATALQKAKETVAIPALVKHLKDLIAAAESERRDIVGAKAEAEKALKAAAAVQKKADEKAAKNGGEDEEEEEIGDYAERFMAMFQKLKGKKDLVFEFLVCDAKPFCGLMMARKITSKHKEELSKISGGSKKFLKIGTCRVDSGKLIFDMEKPPPGLARKLQASIKYYTGKKLPVVVGTETAEDDEETAAQEGARPSGAADAPARPAPPALVKAPDVWNQTRREIATSLGQLKAAVRKEFAEEGKDLVAEIDGNMQKLDRILETLDDKLTDALAKANAATTSGARSTELQRAKTLVTNHIKYIKSEPLIAHIDSNPFGVKTNLKQLLTERLTRVAQAIS